MKIWIFRHFENLPLGNNERLMRTAVLAEYLSSKANDVTWYTSSFDHFTKVQRFHKNTELLWNGVKIKIFKSIGYSKNISLRRLIDHYLIARKVKRHIIDSVHKPDIIYVSFPSISLSKVAVQYSIENKIPCIVEIRDLWPKIFYSSLSNICVSRLFEMSMFILDRNTKFIFEKSTAIFGISEEYLSYGLKYSNRYRIEFDKVFPLGYNSLEINRESEDKLIKKLVFLGVDFSKKIILYIGSSGTQYDWKIIGRIFHRILSENHSGIQFVLCGDGVHFKTHNSQIICLGFIGSDEISILCKKSHVGLLPYVKNAPQGLPNKLFEYMAFGLPVLSSLGKEGMEFIMMNRIGLSYCPSSDTDFYEKLLILVKDFTLHKDFKENAKNIFEKKFSSKTINTQIESTMNQIYNRFQKSC